MKPRILTIAAFEKELSLLTRNGGDADRTLAAYAALFAERELLVGALRGMVDEDDPETLRTMTIVLGQLGRDAESAACAVLATLSQPVDGEPEDPPGMSGPLPDEGGYEQPPIRCGAFGGPPATALEEIVDGMAVALERRARGCLSLEGYEMAMRDTYLELSVFVGMSSHSSAVLLDAVREARAALELGDGLSSRGAREFLVYLLAAIAANGVGR